jgi:hypothetical protein
LGKLFKDVIDERVHNSHGLWWYSCVRMHLQNDQINHSNKKIKIMCLPVVFLLYIYFYFKFINYNSFFIDHLWGAKKIDVESFAKFNQKNCKFSLEFMLEKKIIQTFPNFFDEKWQIFIRNF